MFSRENALHSSSDTRESEENEIEEGEEFSYEFRGEFEDDKNDFQEKKTVGIGDFLPCGPRMYYETSDNVVRMREIAIKKRILIIGVLGSFTPDCWNRHLYLVLDKLSYFQEREVDYICCISTNDAYTQRAWGAYLGCQDTVFMWADTTKRFTKALGMDVVVPWLDKSIRSRRYIILADDLEVKKMIVSPNDHLEMAWQCEHFREEPEIDEEDEVDQWI